MSVDFQSGFPQSTRLYEINTSIWLQELSVKCGKELHLGTVPHSEWDRLENLGFDWVWLMGVWRRSPISRRIALETASLHNSFQNALPGWSEQDVAGSPYSIQAYEPDPRVGGLEDLRRARRELNRRGMGLILDFVPNHTALDHQWAVEHPNRYIRVDPALCRQAPASFASVTTQQGETLCLARGRDPYFPAWTDTLQLNIFEPETRRGLIRTLQRIRSECDGVRCDMAMLLLNSVFRQTWQLEPSDKDGSKAEFWSLLRREVPGFILIAEAYWNMTETLLEQGFDFVYDKTLYDQILSLDVEGLRRSLQAPAGKQARLVRFLENHDEERSLTALGADLIRPASWLLSTLPGVTLYHHGQLEGRRYRIPVQLCRGREERVDKELQDFYGQVLETTSQDCFRRGGFFLQNVVGAGDESHRNLVAFSRELGSEYRLIVINLTKEKAQARIAPGKWLASGGIRRLVDRVDSRVYERTPDELEGGLHVILQPYQSHVFEVGYAQ